MAPTASSFTSGSWCFQICSYIDQGPIFQNPASANSGIAAWMCPGRGRPGITSLNFPITDYGINPWLNDSTAGNPIAPDNKRTLVGVSDGTSNTVFFGHVQINTADYSNNNIAYACGATYNANGALTGGTLGTTVVPNSGIFQKDQSSAGTSLQSAATATTGVRCFGGPFSQGCLMCMADATVRMFPYQMGLGSVASSVGTASTLSAFLTPTGGEAVALPDT
jgi:hypothetical protein